MSSATGATRGQGWKKDVHPVINTQGCMACHLSHSSDQPDLLKDTSSRLCSTCHDYSKDPFKKGHGGYPVEKSSCRCAITRIRLRTRNCLRRAHDPVVSAQCGMCHKPPASDKPFDVTKEGSALCLQCHDEASLAGGGTVKHKPFKEGKCLSCHDPHASENGRLLVRDVNDLCSSCHQKEGAKVADAHAPVESEKGCLSAMRHMPQKTKTCSNRKAKRFVMAATPRKNSP